MSINELLNTDPDKLPEENSTIILDSKSAVCMVKNVKATMYTRQIYRNVYFVRICEKYKMHNIDLFEGDL